MGAQLLAAATGNRCFGRPMNGIGMERAEEEEEEAAAAAAAAAVASVGRQPWLAQ